MRKIVQMNFWLYKTETESQMWKQTYIYQGWRGRDKLKIGINIHAAIYKTIHNC